MTDDAQLLRRFVHENSEAAFSELVAQRIDFVYAAALRQVGGDAHLAQEIAQNVFLDLARKARALAARPSLAGWLYTSTRFAAAKAVRARERRHVHETEAHTMNEILSASARSSVHAADWTELRPVLDVAMHELGAADREAILLRFFEGRSLAEVGSICGVNENTARMRVERALEKLRARLARHGITSTAAALGVTLAAQPAVSVPAGLAISVAGTALAGAAIGNAGLMGASAVAVGFMSTTKLVVVAAALVVAGALGGYWAAQPAVTAKRIAESQTAAATVGNTANATVASAPSVSTPASGGVAGNAVATRAARYASALDELRVLLDLHRRKLVTPELKLVDDSAAITAQFTELFALTPSEQTALQRSLDDTRARLAALARENTTVSRVPNGDVVIVVKPFPETGGAVYDAMLKTFGEILGPDRQQAFVALGVEQSENLLGHFGVSHATMAISRETGASGEARYRLKSHSNVTPEDNANYISDWMTFERLTKELGPYAALLPADFGRGK